MSFISNRLYTNRKVIHLYHYIRTGTKCRIMLQVNAFITWHLGHKKDTKRALINNKDHLPSFISIQLLSISLRACK